MVAGWERNSTTADASGGRALDSADLAAALLQPKTSRTLGPESVGQGHQPANASFFPCISEINV